VAAETPQKAAHVVYSDHDNEVLAYKSLILLGALIPIHLNATFRMQKDAQLPTQLWGKNGGGG
jgi:hypothetical protein